MTKFLSNPIAVSVHNENDERSILSVLFAKLDEKKKDEIQLVIVGDASEAVLNRLENDLAAGISIGYLQLIGEMQKEMPEGIFVKTFAYQEYEYAYKSVIEFGAGIAIAIYQQNYLRKELKEITDDRSIDWSEKTNVGLIKAKELEYKGDKVLTFWEKETNENWTIPREAVIFWKQVGHVFGSDANEIAQKLHEAFEKNKKKDIEKTRKQIEKIVDENL